MKDYSNFFKNPHGFILNYTIENGEILVYTSKSKKGQPHRIPATPENIKEIESKLEKQYNKINEHIKAKQMAKAREMEDRSYDYSEN